MSWIIDRLKESSTWGGIGIILIGLGVLFSGELIFIGLGCGVLGMIIKEDKYSQPIIFILPIIFIFG